MSGPSARRGFAFQDLVLAERVLAHIVRSRAASITVAPLPPLQFWVEASPDANQGPEWDLVQSDGAELVLEEAKSGAVEADDRWALWRRVRRTIDGSGRTHGSALPIVRLSVNADNLPTKPENWRALAGQSQRAAGTWHSPGKDEPKRSVSTAEDLANEALHILSSPDADELSKPIDLPTARRLLSRFSLEESFTAASVEQRVREHLAALSNDVGVNELLNGLRGEIAQRAESKDPTAHRFTSEDLLRTFSMLERLASIDPATLRRWRTLRDCATSNTSASSAFAPEGLPYQDWRSLHPDLANDLSAGLTHPTALVGRGGLGKSVVLGRWLSEQQGAVECLFLSSSDLDALTPDELSATLDLGTFAANHQGRKLFVGVDAIENIASGRRKAILSVLRGTAENGAAVCVTCRLIEWRTERGTNEDVPGWRAVELGEWPDSRVEEHVGASDRPNVGPDLRRLLRTPLMLDLFLRTFGQGEQVPPGLQSRHGLLDAYWNRRILPVNDGRSMARRSTILGAAAGEANGIHLHSLLGEDALQLVSEGLFSLGPGGQHFFRHALLRDFAIAVWAHDGVRAAAQVSDKLASVASSRVQFGALRACLEGSRFGSAELLCGLARPLLTQAGTILGEFDDLALLNFEQIVESLTSDSRPDFLSALLASVKLAQNALWLALLSNLPNEELWAEHKTWLTASVFQQIERAVESMSATGSLNVAIKERIAKQLRSWSSAPRLRGELAAGSGWTLGHLGRLLVKLDPSLETAKWLLGITATGADARFWVLGELPALIEAVALAPASDDDLLRRLFLSAAGLREEVGLLRDDPTAPRNAMTGHDRITACLVNDGKGLLASQPSVFVPISAALLAGFEQERADEEEERRARWLATPSNQFEDLTEPFEPLRRSAEKQEAVQAVANLATLEASAFESSRRGARPARFPASLAAAYWDLQDSEYLELLLHLKAMFERSLSSKDALFERLYWPSVRSSSSARLRTCMLDLVTRRDPSPSPAVLDELLQDERFYTLSYAHRYLQRGIRQRWHALPASARYAIIDYVRGSALFPAGNIFLPGPLLSAIPEAERPPETKVFIELLEAAGHSLELPEPEAEPLALAVPQRIQPTPREAIGSLSAARLSLWQRLADLPDQDLSASDEAKWVGIVDLARTLIEECLPSPEHLVGHTDLLQKLADVVDALGQRASHGASIESDTLIALANWSLSALSAFSAAEVTAGCEPFSGTFVGLPPKAALWIAMARLTDRLLWLPSLPDQARLNAGLFDAITIPAKGAPDRFAYYLLTRISGWLRGDGAGRNVLRGLLLESVQNGNVASEGLRWVKSFTRAEQQDLLMNWLASDHTQPMQHQRDFVRKAGEYVGCMSMVRSQPSGEPMGGSSVFDQLVPKPPQHGVLADPVLHALFVGQCVYGAKLALVNGAVPLERATEFFLRIATCWNSLLPKMSDNEAGDRPAVALWALGPILDTRVDSKHSLATNDRLAWWRAASATALAIVREGPWQEIDHLMGPLSDSDLLGSLTITDLRPLLEALDERTRKIPEGEARYRWGHALTSAATVVERVATVTTDATVQDWLFSLVSSWATAPLSNERAGEVARNLISTS